jgi:hypothetical protein
MRMQPEAAEWREGRAHNDGDARFAKGQSMDGDIEVTNATIEGSAMEARHTAASTTTDPRHQQYEWLRTQCPAYRDEDSKTFFLTRHADVFGVLNDGHVRDPGKAEPGTFLVWTMPETPWRPEDRDRRMGWMDDPEHARVRGPIARAFHRRVIAARPAIEAFVRDRLDQLGKAPGFDVVRDYAMPIPIEGIAHILGVHDDDLPRLRALSEGMWKVWETGRSAEDDAVMNESNRELAELMDQIMAERRRAPREDLISDLLAFQAGGGHLTDSEIRVNVIELLVGGHMTTTDFIGITTRLLLTHPSERRKLEADPDCIGQVVEEALRFEPPVESIHRIAARDFAIDGCPIRAGQVLSVSLPSANRDPDAHADPHRFDVSRDDRRHVSFGGGSHICIGLALARLESQIAIGELFRRFPDLRLAEPDAEPDWKTIPFFRGLQRLPVLS